MKKNKLIPALLIGALMMTSVAFADNNANGQAAPEPDKAKQVMMVMAKAAIKPFTETQQNTLTAEFGKMLAKQVESGVITKEDSDMLTEQFKMSIGAGFRVPAKIGEKGFFFNNVEDFKNLPLEERKKKMMEDMANMTKKEVAAGAITQEEADKRLDDLKKQLESWDGSTPIAFGMKTAMPGAPVEVESIGLEQFKDLTLAQKVEKIVDTIKSKLTKWDGKSPVIFEIGTPEKLTISKAMWSVNNDNVGLFTINAEDGNLPLDQKKENILKKLTMEYNDMVKQGAITQEEADKLIAEVQEKLKNWDGKSPLQFEIKAGGNDKDIFIKLQ